MTSPDMSEATQAVATTSQPINDEVPWTGRDLLQAIGFVIAVVSFVIVLIALRRTLLDGIPPSERARATDPAALALTAAIEVAILAAVWFFGPRRYGVGWSRLGYRPISWQVIVSTVPLAVILAFAALAAYGLLVRVLGLDILEPTGVPDRFLDDPLTAGVLFILAVLIAPVVEETFFRGFAFTALRRQGVWKAAGVSSLLFGLAHASPGLLVPTLVLGLFLTYLFQRTGSLWSPILAHAGFNAISLTLAFA